MKAGRNVAVEVRAGYKRTEVGAIPEDWVVESVRNIGEIKTGPFGTLLKADEYSAGDGTPVIGMREIRDGRLEVDDKTPKLPHSVVKRLHEYILKSGDLVFGRKGNINRSAMVKDDQSGWFLGTDGIRIRPLKPFDSAFLSYQFQRAEIQSWLLRNAIGTTMASMNPDILRRLSIPIPPLPEQRAIATTLSDVDTLITALEELIAKKRDIRQGAIQELLTGKRRLPGFEGKWGNVKFVDVADKNIKWSITGGPFGSNLVASDYVSEGVRIIQLQNIGDGIFHDNYAIYTTEKKADELLSCNIYPDEIILSKMGDPVSRACFVPRMDRRYLMASDGIRLVVDIKRFDKKFVHDYINSIYFRKRAIEASSGTTRQRIGLGVLKQLPFVEPPLPEQQAIATVLSDMDAELAALEQQRDKTKALKQGMMQELLTGRIRLV